MLTGRIRADVDQVWDRIWSSGVSNPLTCVEYIAVILAATRSPEGERLERALGQGDVDGVAASLERVHDSTGLGSRALTDEHSPWRDLSTVQASYEVLRDLHVTDRNHDLVGDIFEYVLSKLSTAGQFGQFRTPRHIIRFIVDAVDPRPGETILDPACGTGGFLIAAAEHLSRWRTSPETRYIGQEVDTTVGRLAKSNLYLHDVPNSVVQVGDSLGDTTTRADVVLANPPFAGMVSADRVASYRCGSSRTEMLFLEHMMSALNEGGRAGVVVPFGVLTSTNASAVYIRRSMVEDHGLTAVVELPPGVFRPYTDVRTALLFWTGHAVTQDILFARATSDGYTLDDRRTECTLNDIPAILEVLRGSTPPDGRLAVARPASSLERDRYILNPSRYLESSVERSPVGDAREFPAVIDDITDRLHEITQLVTTLRKADSDEH